MERDPPADVIQTLAEEVGFGCPVPGCGSPYLTWHHFDPPWAIKEHHDPAGMVALCRDHHPEADGGAFTIDDLRRFKQEGRQQTALIGARFNWMREQLLVRLGGMFYYETPVALQIGTNPVVWFNRDPSNRILLNLTMPTTSGQPRLVMRDNFWLTEGANIKTIKCPPSGKLVTVTYQNDDRLRVEFREVESTEELDRRYPVKAHKPPKWARDLPGGAVPSTPTPNSASAADAGITYPVAVAEITMRVTGSRLRLDPNKTTIGGGTFLGGWIVNCGVGVQIG